MSTSDLQSLASDIQDAMFLAMNKTGDVEVQVSDSDDSIEIVRIIAGEGGAGLGTKAMLAACEVADSQGVILELTPSGSYFEDEDAALSRLIVFYGRFGFLDSGHGTMVRTPVSEQDHPRMRM